MTLETLLTGLPFTCLKGALDVEISDIENDSRRVGKGALYIALRGATVDGHVFLQNAIACGAVAVLIESEKYAEALQNDNDITIVVLEKPVQYLALLASKFFGYPSERMNIIGITGTNGKTSVAQMISDALGSFGEKTAVFGTIGNRIGNSFYETSNTTLEPIALQRLFKKAADEGISTLVMEVSSHGLELGRVNETRFTCAVFTNLTEEHLDFHETMEAYYQAKKRLFLINQGISIINVDDAYGLRLSEELMLLGKPVLTYGLAERCDFNASDVVWLSDGTRYLLKMPEFHSEVKVCGFGRIQVYNTLAVFAVLHAMGYSSKSLVEAAAYLRSVPGRMEHVGEQKEADVFVDFAHTPDALKNVLLISRELTKGQLKVVFGCGGDRDRKKRPMMGRIASSLADEMIITSDNPRTEDPDAILLEIMDGVVQEKKSEVRINRDRKEAIRAAVLGLKQGDVLVVAGKGHENYQIIGREKFHFDDREEVLKALEEKARKTSEAQHD